MRVAAAQLHPVWLDAGATARKVVDALEEAAAQEAGLAVFPESFLPGYPFWVMLGGGGTMADADGRRAYADYLDAAVALEGPELREIAQAVRDLGVFTYLGVAERPADGGRGTVYCTLVAIDPRRGVVSAHRKLRPTHAERMVWGAGDGHGLAVHDVGGLRVGGLSCWENWMPLARHALYAQGEDLHVATWPGSVRGTRDVARLIALEGRAHVVVASGLLSAEDVPAGFPFRDLLAQAPADAYNGGSAVAAPDGSWLVEPLADEERLIVADLDPAAVRAARQSFDPAGHSFRPDVFDVAVDRRRREGAAFRDGG